MPSVLYPISRNTDSAGDGDHGAFEAPARSLRACASGLFVLGKDIAERLGSFVGGLGSPDRAARSRSSMLGLDMRRYLIYCGIIPTGISSVPPIHSPAGSASSAPRISSGFCCSRRWPYTLPDRRRFRDRSAGGAGHRAGPRAQDPGAGFHPRPHSVDRAETGAGIRADRLHRTASRAVLAGAAAAGGVGRHRPGSARHAGVHAAGGGAYLSFLLFVATSVAGDLRCELLVRVVFLAMVGNLANTLAEDLRMRSRRYRQTAEQLAEANAQLRQAEEAVRRSDRLAAWGSFRPVWRTNCAIPWAPSRRRPKC